MSENVKNEGVNINVPLKELFVKSGQPVNKVIGASPGEFILECQHCKCTRFAAFVTPVTGTLDTARVSTLVCTKCFVRFHCDDKGVLQGDGKLSINKRMRRLDINES